MSPETGRNETKRTGAVGGGAMRAAAMRCARPRVHGLSMCKMPLHTGTCAVAGWVLFMPFHLSPCSLAVGTALSVLALSASAQDTVNAPVTVSATRVDMRDQDAPYASEVHTRSDIQRSGTTSLFDYLAQQSSLQITPSYGNRYTPNISMRGYGSDGYQNLVISINGRRLNNIDMVPQLIGAISLEDIERIEITKGSGAVLFGDGATAGTIQIYTKPRNGVSLETYAGNYGNRGAITSAGLVREKFDLSATLDHSRAGGFSDKDPSGHKDQSEANTWRVGAGVQPIDGLRLEMEAGSSHIDTRYPNSLALAQFNANPGMSKNNLYTQQKLQTDHWSLAADYQLTPQWKLSARHHDEDKSSVYPPSPSASDYRYVSNELAVQFQHDALVLNAGFQNFDGERSQTGSRTTKDNRGLFLHGQYMLNALTLSAGLRKEQVTYRHAPLGGTAIEADKRLTSWELGANHRLSPQLALFANYSDAFITPDVDRFFTTDWMTGITTFNGFIEPAKVRTLTVGANHQTERNRLKVSAFYAKLSNEIYLDPFSFTNTNIDKSHKYGLEVQDRVQITPRLSGHINYAWTRALIDRENDGAGAFNGKDLPGVSRHSVVLGLNWRVAEHGHLSLSHTWRSSAWAEGDFDNNNLQRQKAFQSTDVSYRHQLAKQLEMYVGISNLFDRKNGLWVRDDAIYPVNFERTWKLGARIQF